MEVTRVRALKQDTLVETGMQDTQSHIGAVPSRVSLPAAVRHGAGMSKAVWGNGIDREGAAERLQPAG